MKPPEWLTDALIIILILALFFTKCNWSKSSSSSKGADTVTVHEVVEKHDTVTVYKMQTVAKWYAKHDTVFMVDFDTIKISDSDCDSVRKTVAYNRDSTVKVTSMVHGLLLSQIIDSRITNTTTTITLPAKVQRYAVYGGFNVQIGSICPILELESQKGKISVGYNLINQSPQLGYSYKLFSK